MKVVSVATADSRAYYSILSRLKKTNLHFVSLTPSQAVSEQREPVITTKKELDFFNEVTSIPIEELDENPLIMEGQILSRMFKEDKRTILVGVDPGSRIGIVVFYGSVELGSLTVNSLDSLLGKISNVVREIPHVKAVVKVGDGAARMSDAIASGISREFPEVLVEIVDEKGTSMIGTKFKGLTRDQSAATRIAFRKGSVFRQHYVGRQQSPGIQSPGLSAR